MNTTESKPRIDPKAVLSDIREVSQLISGFLKKSRLFPLGAPAQDIKQIVTLIGSEMIHVKIAETMAIAKLPPVDRILSYEKYREHVAARKKNIEDAILGGSRDGAIPAEVFARIEKELKLL